LVARWRRAHRVRERAELEDALKHVHRCESHGQTPTLQSLAGALEVPADRAAELMSRLQARELIRADGNEYTLTPAGREYALRVVRAHRLWEQYLAEETGFAESDWHGQAEEREHYLSPEEASVLARQLGYPLYDPHGDPIPDQAGDFKPHAGLPLTAMALDQPLKIVHIEDEPEAVYAQLVAEGLSPGLTLRLMEVSSQRVRFWEGENEHVLAPVVAANISVLPVEVAGEAVEPGRGESDLEYIERSLSELRLGERGRVVSISPRLRGVERRRILDLGIMPGTDIQAELSSPSGDPIAYRVRGALIALREEQAGLIMVSPMTEGPKI
jgi:DtxR family Mn-dependent transcriptional regulator